MQIHTGAAMGPLGHDARDEWNLLQIQLMGQSLDGDRFHKGIGHEDFLFAGGSGVAIKGGLDIRMQDFTDVRQAPEKFHGELMRLVGDVLFLHASGSLVIEAFADLVLEHANNAVQERGGLGLDLGGMDQLLVKDAGEEQPQQVAGHRGDDAFGGEVFAVQMVDAAHFGIGGDDLVGKLRDRIHKGSIVQAAAKEKRKGETGITVAYGFVRVFGAGFAYKFFMTGNLKMKDQPAGERPRERLAALGADALSHAELIAILLRTGLKGMNAVEVGKQLLQRYPTLRALAQASVADLQKVKGIGRDKAVTLVAAFALARMIAKELQYESP